MRRTNPNSWCLNYSGHGIGQVSGGGGGGGGGDGLCIDGMSDGSDG